MVVKLNVLVIKTLRGTKFWNQYQLANRAGCSLRTIATAECGDGIGIASLSKIAAALGVDSERIIRQPTMEHEKSGKAIKALGIVVKRLRQDDGLYDIEACWAIGILAAAFDVSSDELTNMSQGHSRITFSLSGNKIKAIQVVREYLGVGLKVAKEVVEGERHINAPASAATAIKDICEKEHGCTVIVRSFNVPPPEDVGRGMDLGDDSLKSPEQGDDGIPF